MRQLVNWFRRKWLEDSLDRELRYHLERRTNDFEQTGLSAKEAHRQALLELGGVAQIQEEVRDIWLTRWLRDFAYDLRFTARSFRKTPSFTITTILSLMLGIGATTAIYSLVDQVLLHALPVRQPERLVSLAGLLDNRIEVGPQGLRLGAAATMAEVAAHPVVIEQFGHSG